MPKNTRALAWMLARRITGAAIAFSALAGGGAYLLETRRAEQAALDRAVDTIRHFEMPAMRIALETGGAADHSELVGRLDRRQFVGVRVFDRSRRLIYQSWADIPPALIEAVRNEPRSWPGKNDIHRYWITAAGERLIEVVLPVSGGNGTLVGYLESVSRLDEAALEAQRARIRDNALTAVVSALVTTFLLYPLLLAMLRQSTDLSRRLIDSNLSLLRALGNAVAKRDSDTDVHNYRVTYYAVALAEALHAGDAEISDLISGALLHDVGKIGVPDTILLKPGPLAADEFEVMKTHVLLGLDIVADNPWLRGAAATIRHHHERYDGTGYPDGLRGHAIPLAARIFAVADVFDALTSQRPYKAPMPCSEALSVIERESGSHFDPAIVTAFQAIAPSLHAAATDGGATGMRRQLALALRRYFSTDTAS